MFVHFKSLVSELSKPNQTLTTTKSLHSLLIKTCLFHDPFYATKITRFYAINNDLTSAHHLFDETPHRTIYLWNSIIRAHAQTHHFHNTFTLFKQMLTSKTSPDHYTFACIARACAESHDLERLKSVHAQVIAFDHRLNHICGSALVSAYSKLDLIHDARLVFDSLSEQDVVLYNTMIAGYAGCGDWENGLSLFNVMRRMGIQPDGYTVVGLLSFCDTGSGLGSGSNVVEFGRGIHGYCLKNGFGSNAHVTSVLVSMYSRCGCMNSAYKVFDGLSQPDLVTWSALISGFSQSHDYANALTFFKTMNSEGRKPDSVLVATLLAAIAQTVVVAPGVEIHGYAIRHYLDSDIMVSSALIDMYSKCGFLETALKLFDEMPERNIVCYNSVISSLGLNGLAREAFEVFKEAVEGGLKPDESTFSALLSACCHGGFVEEGRDIFRRMEVDFGLKAQTAHYVHFVKLLGMAGELEEAYDVVGRLGDDADSSVWGALLSCCDVHNDSKLGEVVACRLFDKEGDRSKYKVMVSNLHAGNGKWDDVKSLRDDLDDVGNKKICGISWIQA